LPAMAVERSTLDVPPLSPASRLLQFRSALGQIDRLPPMPDAERNIMADTQPVGAGLPAMAAERSTLDFPPLSPASRLLQLHLGQIGQVTPVPPMPQ